MHFGADSSDSKISVGATVCSVTLFKSDTSMCCVVAPGIGGDLSISTVVSGQAMTVPRAFSYDAPMITQVSPQRTPTTGGRISISGVNFGTSRYFEEQQVFIGSTECVTETWFSDTSIRCTVDEGSGFQLDVVVKVLGQKSEVNTNERFSYNAPTIDSVSPGFGPGTGGRTITVIGANYGLIGSTNVTLSIGSTDCISTYFGFNSFVLFCILAPGAGLGHILRVTADGQRSSQALAFSYLPPTVGVS
eukprot:354980-Rhodomonas_salina.1